MTAGDPNRQRSDDPKGLREDYLAFVNIFCGLLPVD